MSFWHQMLDAQLGVSAMGFEGGSASVWDEARSARAHGLGVSEDGEVTITRTGRLSIRHRHAVARLSNVEPAIRALPPETRKLLRAAFAPCGPSHAVSTFFDAGTAAPLVGLGLVVWGELKPDDARAPSAILEAWEIALKSPNAPAARKMLAPVKNRALAVYFACVDVYDEIAAYFAREKREARDAEMNDLLRRLGAR